MTEIEMLEHLLSNLRQSKPLNTGLMFRNKPSISIKLHRIDWDNLEDYSLAPIIHTINGFTVPGHAVYPLDEGTIYYVPDLDHPLFYRFVIWDGWESDYRRLERGLVFHTEEDAIANAKAMLGIDPN